MALPEVVGVGALGPTGPAPWSNYGPWLDASAPGTDLVSSFFADFDGALPPINGLDPDEFELIAATPTPAGERLGAAGR